MSRISLRTLSVLASVLLLMINAGLPSLISAADSTISGTSRINDTYIQNRFGGDDNYGGASILPVGWKDDDYPYSIRRAYLWFDIPGNITSCQACTLSLYVSSIDGDPDTLDIFWCTRDAAAYTGNNTATSDAENGEMTWLSYFDDDTADDSLWTTSGGDYSSDIIGTFSWTGSEGTNQRYKIALDSLAIDSILNSSRSNFGLFLIGRVGGSYGSGNTLIIFQQVDYLDNTYGPEITFYSVSSNDSASLLRRRAMICK
ncbi:MAG: hypothetical protein KAR42_05365 [candidate division Zixibacteria bacterium]|nr:hypothetical protein [candidate division Zixibacteria bacterium]